MSLELNQFAYNPESSAYEHGYNSVPVVSVVGAPDDADFSRYAMNFAEESYRLYCFKSGTKDVLYQFKWSGEAYEYGIDDALPELSITGLPDDADVSKFAILYDGEVYRLYVRKLGQPALYQCAWDGESYAFGHESMEEIAVTGFMPSADLSRFDLLFDGDTYRFYCMSFSSPTVVHQAAFNAENGAYEYGFQSIPDIELAEAPDNTAFSDIAMMHDGETYRMFIPAM